MNIVTAPPWSADGVDSRVVLRDGTVATLRITRPTDHEVVGDVRFRVTPLTDLDALHEILLRVSRLAVDVAEIAELDLNPVIALAPGHGCRIVDARVKVSTLA